MARKLEHFPAAAAQRYPWRDWLDGDPWELVRGNDYTAKTTTLISNARIQAKNAGGIVRTRTLTDDGGREVCILQFLQS
jgi:hypothetical protein